MEKKEELSLSIRNITKTYPGVVALNQVSIEFHKGEIHALMGENGAGKSTLMKVISGVTAPDSGYFILGIRNLVRLRRHSRRHAGSRLYIRS